MSDANILDLDALAEAAYNEHREPHDHCRAPILHRVIARAGRAVQDDGLLYELAQLRRIAAAAGRVSDAAIRRADLVGNSTPLMLALGDLDACLGKPLRRIGG